MSESPPTSDALKSDIPTSSNQIKRKRSYSSSSSSSSSSDIVTSSSQSHSKRKKNSCKKKEFKQKVKKCKEKKSMRKKEKKKHKEKKKLKKSKRQEAEEDLDVGPIVPEELKAQSKAMAPMTKEDWEKKQSEIRKVFDEESGRYRLIRGEGEIIEEIVSKERHKEINKQATFGDGVYFQNTLKRK